MKKILKIGLPAILIIISSLFIIFTFGVIIYSTYYTIGLVGIYDFTPGNYTTMSNLKYKSYIAEPEIKSFKGGLSCCYLEIFPEKYNLESYRHIRFITWDDTLNPKYWLNWSFSQGQIGYDECWDPQLYGLKFYVAGENMSNLSFFRLDDLQGENLLTYSIAIYPKDGGVSAPNWNEVVKTNEEKIKPEYAIIPLDKGKVFGNGKYELTGHNSLLIYKVFDGIVIKLLGTVHDKENNIKKFEPVYINLENKYPIYGLSVTNDKEKVYISWVVQEYGTGTHWQKLASITLAYFYWIFSQSDTEGDYSLDFDNIIKIAPQQVNVVNVIDIGTDYDIETGWGCGPMIFSTVEICDTNLFLIDRIVNIGEFPKSGVENIKIMKFTNSLSKTNEYTHTIKYNGDIYTKPSAPYKPRVASNLFTNKELLISVLTFDGKIKVFQPVSTSAVPENYKESIDKAIDITDSPNGIIFNHSICYDKFFDIFYIIFVSSKKFNTDPNIKELSEKLNLEIGDTLKLVKFTRKKNYKKLKFIPKVEKRYMF